MFVRSDAAEFPTCSYSSPQLEGVVHRRWIGNLVGCAFSLIVLFQIEHSISWLTLHKHGRVLWNNPIFFAMTCLVFALFAAAAFLWARSAPSRRTRRAERGWADAVARVGARP